MTDYAQMYKTLFQAMTKAIHILQEAQIATEEMYISAEPPQISLLEPPNQENSDN